MPRYYPFQRLEAQLYEQHDRKRRPALYPPFDLRCPACGSKAILSQTAFVDETNTFALPPGAANPDRRERTYAYQEYRSRICTDCEFRWHTEPTGRWSTRAHEYSGEPYHPQPSLVHDEVTGLPIREIHDFRRATRITTGRFSDEPLAPAIVNAEVIVFTGAGASVPFGFPSAANFRWPEDAQGEIGDLLWGDIWRYGSLEDFFRKAPNAGQRLRLAEAAVCDVEIRLEVLLRLQDLIVQEGGDDAFEQVRSNLGQAFTSWFLFGDFIKNPIYATPPLTTVRLQNDAAVEMTKSSQYFKRVRKLLQQTCQQVTTQCAVPSADGLAAARTILLPPLILLQRMIGGPLPIYTTNYDLTIEYLLGDTLVDGFDYDTIRNDVYYSNKETDVPLPRIMFKPALWQNCTRFALFHLHGAANYFVDPRTGECFCVDSKQELIELMHELAWTSDLPCVLGAIVPATCKERYTYAPHFGIPYDYLAQSLAATKVCVMIGYSCRDEIVKEIIARALALNENLRFLVIGMGEPSPYFVDVVPSDRYAYWDSGFDERACAWILNFFSE